MNREDAKNSEKNKKSEQAPRQGSMRRDVERAEHEPEPHHGRQLISDD